MIVIRVELHSAITGQVTEIAQMEMSNDGRGTDERANYFARTFRGRSAKEFARKQPLREATIRNWPRQQKHVWYLVSQALDLMGYGMERV